MRKYLWIAVIALLASAIYFTSCEKIPKMMDTILPDAEQVETPEVPEPTPEMTATVESPPEVPEPAPEMTATVEPPAEEPETPQEVPVPEPTPPPVPVAVVAVEPPSGSRISPDTTIAVTFDGIPADLTVGTGELSISDANATITGPFMAGTLNLNLIWADGIETLIYTVEEPVPPPPEGMVVIPAGEFEMGSNQIQGAQPVHTVHVDAFYMDIHEVTNLDYKRFLIANPEWRKHRVSRNFTSGPYLDNWDDNNNYPEGQANHPVRYITWNAALAYAKWAGKRLPTEAEWEKAARGGLVSKKYPLGDTISAADANLSGGRNPSPVGSYAPNGYGLYDMGGNVGEWCLDDGSSDFYSWSPSRNPLAGAHPSHTITDLDALSGFSSLTGARKIYRPTGYRGVAERFYTNAYDVLDLIGFRCVQDVPR